MSLGRIALLGALAGSGLGVAWIALPHRPEAPAPRGDRPAATAPVAAPARPSAVPPAAAPSPGVEALAAEVPRFDVARVGARGMLVAAGRAAPHAEVMLFDGAQEIGRARADARGEWVILPVDALAAGTRELSLRARRPGSDVVAGRDVVLLVVPESAVQAGPRSAIPAGTAATDAAPPGPLAVLLPAAGGTRGTEAPRLLQAPPQALPADGPGRRGGRLGLDIVDYEEGGEIRFAGSAPPGATVRLYAGREHLGDARADAAGRWQVTPEGQPEVGRHMLRVDQLGASGSVAARIEVPFQREGPAEEPREGTEQIVVQPGYNLWRIARRVYGRGTRYTLIYDANREQIRDPRRIFPGQVLALPGASAPAASSLSR